jgi:hypothetical protein
MFTADKPLRTISANNGIFAEASIAESFPVSFGIWDLRKFLNIISLFKDPDLQFEEKFVSIAAPGKSKVKYYYTQPSLLHVPTRDIAMPSKDISFKITQEQLEEISKAAAVLGVSDLCLRSNDTGELVLTCLNKKSPTSNEYSIQLSNSGPEVSNSEFEVFFKIENLKFIPGDYTVHLSKKGISNWQGAVVSYFVSVEVDSKIA